MGQKGILFALCVAFWTGTLPLLAAAHAAQKVAIVGRLNPGSAGDPAQAANLEAFREGMRALGHVEGRTYVIEARFAGGDERRLPALAAELVRLRPKVILAAGYLAVQSVKERTNSIPIVMASYAGDPVRAGFVASLARPGGNVTGLAGLLRELNEKQLGLLRELVPGLSRVSILYNANLFSRERLRDTIAAAASLGVKVHLAGVSSAAEIEPAFETIRRAESGGLIVMPDPALMARNRSLVAELAVRHHLPSAFTFRTFAQAGGLMSYSHDVRELHRRSAIYVDKILKGAKPAALPVERPTKFELVINMKTARALGITVPPAVLLRADEVIE